MSEGLGTALTVLNQYQMPMIAMMPDEDERIAVDEVITAPCGAWRHHREPEAISDEGGAHRRFTPRDRY